MSAELAALKQFNDQLTAGGAELTPRFSPELLTLAESWPTFPSWVTLNAADVDCLRCQECKGVIYAAEGVLGHLLREHGYRMDGRCWTDQNEEISSPCP